MTEPTEWLTIEQVATATDQSVVQVRRLLRENKLIAVRRAGATLVPADFVDDAALVKGLSGTLLLLHDAGYDAEEAIRWLYLVDDTLPGSPIQALRENRGSEVRRRAQAAGF